MNVLRITITALAILLLITPQTIAQDAQPVSLFEAPVLEKQAKNLPDHELNRQYVTANLSALQLEQLHPGDAVSYRVGEEVRQFQIERAISYTGGTFSILARESGSPGNHLTLTMEEDRLKGTVHLHNYREVYHLGYDKDQRSNYMARIESGQLDVAECAVDDEFGTDTLFHTHSPRMQTQKELAETESEEVEIIDLMIVYTQAAANWMSAHSSINLVIAEAMNISQLAIDNSEVKIELQLVHTHKTDYREGDDTSGEMLRKLTTKPGVTYPWGDEFDGYMEEVHDLRDRYGADVVSLFANVSGFGGIGWLLRSTEGRPDYAFNVNRVQQMHFSTTMVHEIGHNMGNHHSRNQASAAAGWDGGLFNYSTGWRWTGDDGNGYVSVMTYVEDLDGNEDYTRVPYFSNPDISYEGQVTGSYHDSYAPADNALSMNEIRSVIAGYREVPTPPDSPPAAPVLTIPEDGAEGVSLTGQLGWQRTDETDQYRAQVSSTPDFSSLEIDEVLTQTYLNLDNLLNDLTDYYWRVKAENVVGAGDWSETRSFQTVIEAPENVTLSSPADGSFQIPTNSELIWFESDRAEEYIVQISEEKSFGSLVGEFNTNEPRFSEGSALDPETIYYWRVRASNEGGKSEWSNVWMMTTLIEETAMEANYPNPFNNATTINYQLSEQSNVVLEVYDIAGRKVTTLVNEQKEPRIHTVVLDGANMASGIYILRIRIGDFTDTQRITLIK